MTDEAHAANFNRPPRIQFPNFEDEEVSIPAPPVRQEAPEQNLLVTILPALGMIAMTMAFLSRALTSNVGSETGNLVRLDTFCLILPMLVIALASVAGPLLTQRSQAKDREQKNLEAEQKYRRLLEQKRVRLQAARDAQLAILEYNFPAPDHWLNLALNRDNRLWERRPGDPDFTALRVGLGHTPSLVEIQTPDADTTSESIDLAFALADEYRYLNDAPVIMSLRQDVSIGFAGKRMLMLRSVRAAICHLAVTHAPQDLRIHLIASQANYEDWRWLEWLPHTSLNQQTGTADLMAFDTEDIRNLMGNLSQTVDERRERGDTGSKTPHLLVIIDGPQLVESEAVYSTILREGHLVGASALCLVNAYQNIPSDCGAIVEISDNEHFRYARTESDGYEVEGDVLDGLSAQDAEYIARGLSAVVVREVGGSGRIPRRVDFLDLYGIRYVDELPRRLDAWWRRPIKNGELPFPVRIGRESLAVDTVIMLDEDHHGPHGMLAGTTGSGKSELLQTLICALVMEHDPRLLNLLLIDFKGGATFNVFNDLPHTVGTVTNLDSVRVTRALEALKAETTYRQQFLDDANVRDITQYYEYYANDDSKVQAPDYKPLPHLFIIVDEFAQLAKEMPDFMRELVRTVQVGRSLGLHLLLGTQSPMDVVTDEMNANLQFRICLRVQNIEASRAMLRRPDAAYLPAGWPGRGYFQVGEQGMFKQFQTGYVGAEYETRAMREAAEQQDDVVFEVITDSGERIDLLPKTSSNGADHANGAGQDSEDLNMMTQLSDEIAQPVNIQEPHTVAKAIIETVQDYATRYGIKPMPPLLLPPLTETITLQMLFDKCDIGGWDGEHWQAPGTDHNGDPIPLGSVPVGVMDDVYNRTQHPLWINLNAEVEIGGQKDINRKDGHAIIFGSPGTGKTTFLRTLAVGLARLHSPLGLHMFFLSLTGTGLDALGGLPHAEAVVHGTQTERVRRLFGRLIYMLDERQAGAEATDTYIVLFIDQYEQFIDNFGEPHRADLERLVNEGRAVNMFLVMTANGPTTMPERIRSLVQQRVALQLGQGPDYTLTVGRVRNVEEMAFPDGRGFVINNPPLAVQLALPMLDENENELTHIETLVNEMGVYEQGPAPIEPLPTHISLESLPEPVAVGEGIETVLGRYDDDPLTPFQLNWWDDGPYFIVTGPPGSGKTNMLHAAVLAAAQQYSPQDLRFVLVDFNGRSLRPLSNLKHVIARITADTELKGQMTHLQSELQTFHKRRHDDPVPATVLVIDDYDLTTEALNTSNEVFNQLRDHVRFHSHLNLYAWVGGYLERPSDPFIRQLLLRRSGFVLSSKDFLEKLSIRGAYGLPKEEMPAGRAFFPRQNRVDTIVQTALVPDPEAMVELINNQWQQSPVASWENPASDDRVIRDTTSYLKTDERSSREISSDDEVDSGIGDIDVAGLLADFGLISPESGADD